MYLELVLRTKCKLYTFNIYEYTVLMRGGRMACYYTVGSARFTCRREQRRAAQALRHRNTYVPKISRGVRRQPPLHI